MHTNLRSSISNSSYNSSSIKPAADGNGCRHKQQRRWH
jgi:hypothetical protein